jgi:hypothetical protein
MNEDIKKLCKILNEENFIFKQLLKIETLKNELIIKQDIEKLKELTEEEKKYLNNIELKEKERDLIVDSIFERYQINNEKVLTVLINNLPEDNKEEIDLIKKEREELLKNIKDLKKINEINNKLLSESIKFFNSVIKSLDSSDNITYHRSNTGKVHLIDQKV